MVTKYMQPINDNDSLLRQETHKMLHVLEADMIIIKRNIDLMSLVRRIHFFYRTCSKMTAIALVSVINNYHINELHLF